MKNAGFCIPRSLRVALFVGLMALPGALSIHAQVPATADDRVELISKQAEDGGYEFYAVNNHIIPVWLKVEFRELINMVAGVELPFGGLIPPSGKQEFLFRLDARNPSGRRGYSVVYRYARGDPGTVAHDDNHTYLLPFAHGKKFRVSQGYYGSFTHFGENTYALDFDMPEGTPVHAARDGLVVEVKQDSTVGGPSARYSGDANYVMLMHSDGSFGNYVHLRPNGAAVDVGDELRAGDLIGYSGNTGQSSGPHLHFDVRIPQSDGRMQSIPTRFLDHRQRSVQIEEHQFYYAYHPGGPEFEVVLGSELRTEDYAQHVRSIPESGAIEFRTEEIDLSYLLFIGNGFDEAMELEIDIQMRGVHSDKPLPMTMILEPRTERFLTLLRAVPGATQLQFSPHVRYRPVAH